MKATCCLLIYNLELMFAIVDLNAPCFYSEIPRRMLIAAFEMIFFSPNQRVHG